MFSVLSTEYSIGVMSSDRLSRGLSHSVCLSLKLIVALDFYTFIIVYYHYKPVLEFFPQVQNSPFYITSIVIIFLYVFP